MKQVNQIQFLKTQFFIILITIAFAGCIKDPCSGIFCFTYGECINGVCVCENGYVNETCSETLAERYAGDYFVQSTCVDTTYSATISEATTFNTAKGIAISNFKNLNDDWEFNVLVTDEFSSTITNSELDTLIDENENEFFVTTNGSGTRDTSTNTIQLFITYTINGISEVCEEIYTKQE